MYGVPRIIELLDMLMEQNVNKHIIYKFMKMKAEKEGRKGKE